MNSPCTIHRVIYHGRVQGVGFRATTRHIARGYQVAGFVRNLADGTVELVAQGQPQEVRRFLDHVSRQFGPNITAADETRLTEAIATEGFTIR